jgi:hypothetical protein
MMLMGSNAAPHFFSKIIGTYCGLLKITTMADDHVLSPF